MQEFKSVFYKKNKLIFFTLVIYCAIFISGVTSLLYRGYDLTTIILIAFTLAMILRATYFISEKVIVDTENGVVTRKILKKNVHISKIEFVKKIRPGQIRLINKLGDELSMSVENEDEFIELLQSINPKISIESNDQ